MAATNPAPKIAQASACQPADAHRAAAIFAFPNSHVRRRSVIRRSAIPVTRTSFPGEAVVATSNR